ncbi:unnamed protein product, partial [Porites lobata]
MQWVPLPDFHMSSDAAGVRGYGAIFNDQCPGPLFLYQDSTPLSRSKLSAFLKSTLQSNFSGHSFRVGTATTAASRGIPDYLNKTMGCWSSKTYLLYVQT